MRVLQETTLNKSQSTKFRKINSPKIIIVKVNILIFKILIIEENKKKNKEEDKNEESS
jgi:hypothetical protein